MSDDLEGDSRQSDSGEDPVDDLLSELADIFATNFRNARYIHLKYEADTGERYMGTYANFRDAMTHTVKFVRYLDSGKPEEARGELGQVEDHLERVVYDTEKRRVENGIDQVHQRRMPDILYTLTFLEAPSFDEHRRRMQAVKTLYLLARNKRGDSIEDASLPTNDLMDWTGNPPKTFLEVTRRALPRTPNNSSTKRGRKRRTYWRRHLRRRKSSIEESSSWECSLLRSRCFSACRTASWAVR